jgi:hypothetical protein
MQTRPERIVRNLVFNLLENAARTAGCQREAWEVVMEFAEAEVLIGSTAGRVLEEATPERHHSFLLAADALLGCMTGSWERPATGPTPRKTVPPSN